jgi:hypothetical protein
MKLKCDWISDGSTNCTNSVGIFKESAISGYMVKYCKYHWDMFRPISEYPGWESVSEEEYLVWSVMSS